MVTNAGAGYEPRPSEIMLLTQAWAATSDGLARDRIYASPSSYHFLWNNILRILLICDFSRIRLTDYSIICIFIRIISRNSEQKAIPAQGIWYQRVVMLIKWDQMSSSAIPCVIKHRGKCSQYPGCFYLIINSRSVQVISYMFITMYHLIFSSFWEINLCRIIVLRWRLLFAAHLTDNLLSRGIATLLFIALMAMI